MKTESLKLEARSHETSTEESPGLQKVATHHVWLRSTWNVVQNKRTSDFEDLVSKI